jgi:GNAT superfamily N-acetyltransferase
VGCTDPADEGLVLRAAIDADAAAVAEVHLQARRTAVPAMPPSVHTDDEVREWLAGRLRAGADEVWVAEEAGRVVGYARLSGDWLDDLYVLPVSAGRGVGSALLQLVVGRRPDGFSLWVFESNGAARGFYRHHGLVELEVTDGTANEEHSPDVRMAWPGRDPAAFLQRQLAEVDRELVGLHARRTALEAALERLGRPPAAAPPTGPDRS